MSTVKRQQTAKAISVLIPHIVQGAHLGVFVSRSITQTQFLILVCLHSKGICTMGDIASHLKVSMPTVTGLINRLVEAKYIKRIPDPKDRRQVMIGLTPKAHTFLKQFQTIIAQRWMEVLSILDTKELDHFHSIIHKLNDSLEKQRT